MASYLISAEFISPPAFKSVLQIANQISCHIGGSYEPARHHNDMIVRPDLISLPRTLVRGVPKQIGFRLPPE